MLNTLDRTLAGAALFRPSPASRKSSLHVISAGSIECWIGCRTGFRLVRQLGGFCFFAWPPLPRGPTSAAQLGRSGHAWAVAVLTGRGWPWVARQHGPVIMFFEKSAGGLRSGG